MDEDSEGARLRAKVDHLRGLVQDAADALEAPTDRPTREAAARLLRKALETL